MSTLSTRSRRTNAIAAAKPCSAFFPRYPLFDENQLRTRLRRCSPLFFFHSVTAAAHVRLRNKLQTDLKSYHHLRQAVVLFDRQFQVVRLTSCRWLLVRLLYPMHRNIAIKFFSLNRLCFLPKMGKAAFFRGDLSG